MGLEQPHVVYWAQGGPMALAGRFASALACRVGAAGRDALGSPLHWMRANWDRALIWVKDQGSATSG
jgi:hypothetical protein